MGYISPFWVILYGDFIQSLTFSHNSSENSSCGVCIFTSRFPTQFRVDHIMATFMSPRSANRPLTVLLAGSTGFFGSQLYHFLKKKGFHVLPVAREQTHLRVAEKAVTYDQIAKHGLPDCDFVISVTGNNVMLGDWDDHTKGEIERSRISVNKVLANAIRDSQIKPYAFLHASCSSYYPRSESRTYDESFVLPPQPSLEELQDPAVQAREMSLPYFSRMTRAWEAAARVYDPKLDYRTPEQLEYLRQMRIRHDEQERTKAGGIYRGGDPHKDESSRYELLDNSDVRVVHMRMGMLTSTYAPFMTMARDYIEWGVLSRVGTGEQYMPWIHVDDALKMYLFAMINEISGPVNCVAPSLSTNKDYFATARKIFGGISMPFPIPDRLVENRFGLVRAPLLTQSLSVVPKKALDNGFTFKYNTLEDVVKEPKSQFEKYIEKIGGYGQQDRFAVMQPKYH